ncbi:MAG: hypothetical protein ACSW8G_02875 [Bacillota bacterium]
MMKNLKNIHKSFLHYFSFIVALGVLFFVVLMLVGLIEVEHKGRVVILVLLAFAMIYMSFRAPDYDEKKDDEKKDEKKDKEEKEDEKQ